MKGRFEAMPLMIVGIIFGAICITFVMAVLAEVALPGGYVRYAALALFVGATAICAHRLYLFLKTALYEWGTYRDIVPIDKDEHIFLRWDDNAGHRFEELGEQTRKSVLVRARPIEAEPLANAAIDPAFLSRLLNGGNSNG